MTLRSQLIRGGAALAVIVHLAIVLSIAKQPLRVNAQPTEARSLIWKLHHDTVHRAGPGADFFAIYHAGIEQSRGQSPYDNEEDPRVTPEFYPFRYLPIVAQTLGRAATALDPRVAYLTWVVLLEILLGGVLVMLWRVVPALPWRLGLSAALLFSSPYFLELHLGQFTFATCALLAIGLVLLDRSKRRYSIGGTAAFTAAVLLKVFPLTACAALIRNRRGIAAAAVAGGLVLITALPYFLSHPEEWKSFAQVNFGEAGTAGFHGGNYGFLYVVYLGALGFGHEAGVGFHEFARVWQVLALGITAAVVLCRRPTMLTGGLTLACAHTISYIHVWEHHASGAVVVGVFLLVRLAEDPSWRGRWIALGCVILLVLPTPFVLIDSLDPSIIDPTPQWSPLWRFVLPACKGLPMFTLWMLGLAQSCRERDRSAPPQAAITASHA